jgi:hypothetical protein
MMGRQTINPARFDFRQLVNFVKLYSSLEYLNPLIMAGLVKVYF